MREEAFEYQSAESPVPENYLVFTAGESNQTAGVLDEVKHGRFSYFVFKGLEGEADSNQDGKISAGELHAYVKDSVGRFSGARLRRCWVMRVGGCCSESIRSYGFSLILYPNRKRETGTSQN